ncbi:MAG: bifunctional metallophosphatase/5'-nucleotidase [Dehalococcoidia bacterium]|nr:MAG: bifunctional metallophosphatase/5'-nucleotidase [Dehalococcoidia bacterium]
MGTTRKFTILHSNDMHGDFLAEASAGKGDLIGGLALLSGYINKVRKEEGNVLYVIAGDMVQGSLIDAEYKGISTMEIMNYLAPDVVTLGNHEFDYGLPHLLFLEKVANFPIVNANLYIKGYNKRLMKPFQVIPKAGFDIMFIGIITDKVIDSVKKDSLVGSFISLEEASREVGIITDAYKHDDIDLTVLLTHIGYDSDIELAKLLRPEWGVDIIIGGHSHTILEHPAKVNNVLIAQAGVGTNQIGRFDITVDDDTNSIIDYKWQLIPIEQGIAEPDTKLQEYIDSFATVVDRKYGSIICKFTEALTHPRREVETPLGDLFADALAEMGECDVMFVGSGSIRSTELGPVVTLKDYRSCFPYEDYMSRFTVTGKTLKTMFARFMRTENRNGEGECYQVNGKIRAVYNDAAHQLTSLTFDGQPVEDNKLYTAGLIGYHIINCEPYFGVTQEELLAAGKSKVIATNVTDVLEEYLKGHQNIGRKVEGRLVYV